MDDQTKNRVFLGKPGEIQLVSLDLIDDNPYQPKNRPYGNILTFAADIRQQREVLPATMGLIHVPRGRIVDGRVQLLEGHRRTRAFRLLVEQYGADWQQMPLDLDEFTDRQMSELSWSENNNREDLDPISRAESLQRAIDEFGLTLKEAGKRYSGKKGPMSKGAVSNLIRLLQLPEAVQELVRKGKIGQRHGRELVRLVQHEPPLVKECKRIAQACLDGRSVDSLASGIDTTLQQKKREAERETRYCCACGAEREFTGLEIDSYPSWTECKCGYSGPANTWRKKPLPELPTEPVIFGTELNMSGWWWCNFCESHEQPGRTRWVTIGGQEMKVCHRCEERLRPLAVEADPDEATQQFGDETKWLNPAQVDVDTNLPVPAPPPEKAEAPQPPLPPPPLPEKLEPTQPSFPPPPPPKSKINAPSGWLNRITIRPDGNCLITLSQSGTDRKVDLKAHIGNVKIMVDGKNILTEYIPADQLNRMRGEPALLEKL